MKPIKFYKLLLPILCFFLSLSLTAQHIPDDIWMDVQQEKIADKGNRYIIPSKYRTVRLDQEILKEILLIAPMEFSSDSRNSKSILAFPMPDGTSEYFRIVQSPIVEKELLDKYPDLKTYAGQGINDPSATIRFDLLSNGFHAMMRSNKGVFFVDPYSQGDKENYISYNVADHHGNHHFTCHTHHDDELSKIVEQAMTLQKTAGQPVGENLRTYRIAIAATGEYTSFHGGTVADGLAAIVTSLNRINEVYETEVATRLILVADNDDIVYTNSNTDPYTNNDLNAILDENQANLANIIGLNNFDIGHVYGTAGGGLAGVGVVCNNSAKAWGATGINSPIGDFFSVAYVCHEIGHQFNAPHTFNSCQGDGGSVTAFEPGSGTTIMAYAGLCGTDNVQFNTDPHFHTGSYERMINAGNTCAVLVPTGNSAPVVETTDPDGLTLPIGTPFVLTGSATDVDNDELTYSWEEVDLGPISALGSPTDNAPLFRSFSPVDVPYRIFPKISDIVNNVSDEAEMLPMYTRGMNFRLTARDNKMGGGGVNYDGYTIQVTGQAGPFVVMGPNTNLDWVVGETEMVTWDVANTDQAPVSCSTVNILLSTDGGYTYPITLATAVPNSGSASIEVPNNLGSNNRVKVECAENVFFDISNEDFAIIEPTTASFVIQTSPQNQNLCADESAVFTLDLSSLSGFNETVSFTSSGLPDGANISFSPNTIVPSGTVEMTITNLQNSNSGDYTVTINAISNSLSLSTVVNLELYNGTPEAVQMLSPSSGTMEVAGGSTLTWDDMDDAMNYDVEISTSPNFDTDLETVTITETSYTPQNYDDYTIYYWRVKANNLCGEGSFSDIFAFQTKQSPCLVYSAEDTPINISSDGPNTINSTIFVMDDFTITDVNLIGVKGNHTYLGDLFFSIESPVGTTVSLMQQVCGSEDDFNLSFDDDATNSTIVCPATDEGTYQPAGSLANIVGESSSGEWNLRIQDGFNNDGGNLEKWQLELCRTVELVEQPTLLKNEMLTVADGEIGLVSNNLLLVNSTMNSDELVVFKLLSLPQYGALWRSNEVLQIGDEFTQADINNNLINYAHSTTGTTNDAFNFDVITDNGGWINGRTFSIQITNSILSASAIQLNSPSCYNSNDAQVSVLATGGTAPYEYSIDGTSFQMSNEFSNLAAGTYTFSIQDADNNIITTAPITIEQPQTITLSTSIMANMLTVSASGGTGTISYSIDSINFQESNIFENLNPGNYTLIAKDENDCENNTSFTIEQNTLVVSANIVNLPTCYNGSDGSVMVNTAGGTPPFEYSIDNENYQTSNIFENLSSGNYIFQIRDANSFTMQTNVVSIANPAPISISTSVVADAITISVTGGTAPYQYSLDGEDFQMSNTFTNLEGGQYTVVTKDANGCENEVTTSVEANTLSVIAILDQEISCHGMTDGKIIIAAQMGTPPYQYSLDGENFQSTNIFNNLGEGSYTVVVKDFQGFSRMGSTIVLTEPSPIEVNPILNANVLTVAASGGTGTYTYSLDGENFQTSNTFNFLQNGDYDIFVKDGNGCIEQSSQTVTGNNITTIAIAEQAACFEENNGVITAFASGGVAPYEYSMDGENFQEENIFTNLDAGVYEVVIVDNLGFTNKTNAATVIENPEIIIGATVNENDVLVNAAGGVAPYEYSLDGINYQSTAMFQNVEHGDYILYVRDDNNCVATQEISVTLVGLFNPNPDLTFKVFPNPTTGLFTIELNQPTEQNLQITIFDAAGKLLFKDLQIKNTDNFQTTINTNYLPNGIYQLRIEDGVYFGVKKLVVLK